jgi:hypothetical protein
VELQSDFAEMRGNTGNFTDDQIREAIAYHDKEGASWGEAAERLGMSLSRLMVRVAKIEGRPYPSSFYRAIGNGRISPKEFAKLREAQNGRCAICGKVTERFVVDHRWETLEVRGLLCTPCNGALGWIEKEGWLQRALAYLGKTHELSLDYATSSTSGRHRGRRLWYSEKQIEEAAARFADGETLREIRKSVKNRAGKMITELRLSQRIALFEKRKGEENAEREP